MFLWCISCLDQMFSTHSSSGMKENFEKKESTGYLYQCQFCIFCSFLMSLPILPLWILCVKQCLMGVIFSTTLQTNAICFMNVWIIILHFFQSLFRHISMGYQKKFSSFSCSPSALPSGSVFSTPTRTSKEYLQFPIVAPHHVAVQESHHIVLPAFFAASTSSGSLHQAQQSLYQLSPVILEGL